MKLEFNLEYSITRNSLDLSLSMVRTLDAVPSHVRFMKLYLRNESSKTTKPHHNT